jgi:hypothetical protein
MPASRGHLFRLDAGGSRRLSPGLAGLTSLGFDLEDRSHWHGGLEVELDPVRAQLRPAGQRHNVAQGGQHDPLMGRSALWTLVVLLNEAATTHVVLGDPLDLHQQPEQVRPPTPEAELVVDEPLRAHFNRKALIRMSYCCASRE